MFISTTQDHAQFTLPIRNNDARDKAGHFTQKYIIESSSRSDNKPLSLRAVVKAALVGTAIYHIGSVNGFTMQNDDSQKALIKTDNLSANITNVNSFTGYRVTEGDVTDDPVFSDQWLKNMFKEHEKEFKNDKRNRLVGSDQGPYNSVQDNPVQDLESPPPNNEEKDQLRSSLKRARYKRSKADTVIFLDKNKPIEQPVMVLHNNKKACVTNDIHWNRHYLKLSTECSDEKTIDFKPRFDIFGRISCKNDKDNFSLCLTLPAKPVLSKNCQAKYLEMEPCRFGDKNQLWRYHKDSNTLTTDSIFKENNHNQYAVTVSDDRLSVSNNCKISPKLTLTDMNNWVTMSAQPIDINVILDPYWSGVISNYYPLGLGNLWNPELGYIYSTFEHLITDTKCLKSKLDGSSGYDWKSITWENCPSNNENIKSFKWSIQSASKSKITIFDGHGNYLLTSYDPNSWYLNYPLSATPYYTLYQLKEDWVVKEFKSGSDFLTSRFIPWFYGNLAQTLTSCPGINQSNRQKRHPSPDFNINQWSNFLYSIAMTKNTDCENDAIGFCGVCFVQSVEMAWQLINASGGRPEPVIDGHYFNITVGGNPLASYRGGLPALSSLVEVPHNATLQDASSIRPILTQASNPAGMLRDRVYGPLNSMLPQAWVTNEYSGIGLESAFDQILANRVGTVTVASLSYIGNQGFEHHQLTIYTGNAGAHVMHTNLREGRTLDQYSGWMVPASDRQTLINRFYEPGFTSLSRTTAIVLNSVSPPSSSVNSEPELSLPFDCFGRGPRQRGTGELPDVRRSHSCFDNSCHISR